MDIGNRIRGIRERLKMNQRELAEASRLTPATVSRIESGRVKQLKSETLNKIAAALHTSADVLLGKHDGTMDISITLPKISAKGIIQVKQFAAFVAAEEKKHEEGNE